MKIIIAFLIVYLICGIVRSIKIYKVFNSDSLYEEIINEIPKYLHVHIDIIKSYFDAGLGYKICMFIVWMFVSPLSEIIVYVKSES